jgi:hypothetical protein
MIASRLIIFPPIYIEEREMDSTDLDFSFDMEGLDRQALLAEAANVLDARRSHMGGTTEKVPETPEGELSRALIEDVAKFAAFPEVYKIEDKDFLARNATVPFRFEELTKDYNFYWLRFPILLFPQHYWAFNRLEMRIQLSATGAAAYYQPRAYQILPAKRFQTLMEVDTRLEVRLDENFEFSAQTIPLGMDLGYAQIGGGGGVGTRIESGVGLVVGPFVHSFKKAKIDHTPIGMEYVFWRIDGAEFFQDDDLQLVVIAQMPKDTKKVTVTAVMQAYRYFVFASAGLRRAITELPEALNTFFKNGAPIHSKATWDISPLLLSDTSLPPQDNVTVECPRCHVSVPSSTNFCVNCTLPFICRSCKARLENPLSKFCSECGQPLGS